MASLIMVYFSPRKIIKLYSYHLQYLANSLQINLFFFHLFLYPLKELDSPPVIIPFSTVLTNQRLHWDKNNVPSLLNLLFNLFPYNIFTIANNTLHFFLA